MTRVKPKDLLELQGNNYRFFFIFTLFYFSRRPTTFSHLGCVYYYARILYFVLFRYLSLLHIVYRYNRIVVGFRSDDTLLRGIDDNKIISANLVQYKKMFSFSCLLMNTNYCTTSM